MTSERWTQTIEAHGTAPPGQQEFSGAPCPDGGLVSLYCGGSYGKTVS